MLSDAEIAALLEAGYESTSVEFKGPESVSSTAFVAKVARAAMAMANQRDGGHITIGLDEKDPTRRGLSRQQLNDWMDYDSVVDKINRFADPPLRVERAARKLPDGQDVVVLQVAEFDQVPVLAARDFQGIIDRGRIYTRSMRKPESTGRQSQSELRHLL